LVVLLDADLDPHGGCWFGSLDDGEVRGEGWHLEVRWWWGSSRADGRRIRAGKMMDLQVNSRIFS